MAREPSPSVDEPGAYKSAFPLLEEIHDVRQMCNPHLEEPISRAEEVQLLTIREHARREQQKLSLMCDLGELPPDEYLRRVIVLSSDVASQNLAVLGPARFACVFGEAVLQQPEGLIDRAAFLATFEA